MAKRNNCELLDEDDDKRSVKKIKIENNETDFIPTTPEHSPNYYMPHSPTYTPPQSPIIQEVINYNSVEHLYKLSKSIDSAKLETFSNIGDKIYGHDFYKLGEFRQEPTYNPKIILPQPLLPQLIVNNNMDCDIDIINNLNRKHIMDTQTQTMKTIANAKFSKTKRPFISFNVSFCHIPKVCIKCMSMICIC